MITIKKKHLIAGFVVFDACAILYLLKIIFGGAIH